MRLISVPSRPGLTRTCLLISRELSLFVTRSLNRSRKKKWSLKLPLRSWAELTRFRLKLCDEIWGESPKTMSSEATHSTVDFFFLESISLQPSGDTAFCSLSAQQPLNWGADFHFFPAPSHFSGARKANDLWFHPKVVVFSWWVQAQQPRSGALSLKIVGSGGEVEVKLWSDES